MHISERGWKNNFSDIEGKLLKLKKLKEKILIISKYLSENEFLPNYILRVFKKTEFHKKMFVRL